jgi:hypothetical protein
MSFEAVLGNKEFELIVSQSDCHSDPDTCAPEVMVPDGRVFSSMQYEQKYPWIYDSVVHQGYLCKFCELFCGHSSSLYYQL